MSTARSVRAAAAPLEDWPIPNEQIREGSPRASGLSLHEGQAGAGTGVWEVTEGSFDWAYETNQSLFVLSGRADVAIEGGPSLRLEAGDAAFFPAGTRARWTVRSKLRKVYTTYP